MCAGARVIALIALIALIGSYVSLGSGCWSPLPSPCHEEMLARHGCCPLCDLDCRAALSAECSSDEHPSEELPHADSESSESGEEGDHVID
jgi:hypothetical protein